MSSRGETRADVRFEEVRLRELSEEEAAAYHTFSLVMEHETHPDDPPTPLSLFGAQKQNIPNFVDVWCFLARDSHDAVVGAGTAGALMTGDNPHVLQVGARVLPACRREGIGRELLRLLVGVAEREGKSLLVGETSDRVPAGAELCRRAGARPGMEVHTNRLVLSALDRSLLRSWVEEGPTRAPGYELIGFDGPCPDELVEALAQLLDVMNDAPRDELRVDDMHFAVEHLRDWERWTRRRATSVGGCSPERWAPTSWPGSRTSRGTPPTPRRSSRAIRGCSPRTGGRPSGSG